MKTYNRIHFNEICRILTDAAKGVGAVSGYSYVLSDMILSLTELSKKFHEGSKESFYFAIREQGTECGSKENCIERCSCLGYPLVIAKIERDACMDLNMTIMFTHNWMSGDNKYMEQEFNSL